MTEEEKKLFEAIKYKNKHLFLVKVDADFLINLIEEQQKELNSLKEIEQLHQEENGKLRVELEQYKLLEANIDKANKIIAENKFDKGLYGLLMQEKEKNKELEEKLKIAKQLYNDACVCIATDCVEKDKIKEMKEFYINEHKNKDITLIPIKNIIENINILLEEK